MTSLNIFSTPLFYEEIKNIEKESNELIELCYKLKSSLPTVELTNNGGYQSRNIVETIEFQNLIKKLQKPIDNFLKEYQFDVKLKIDIPNVWLNLNNEGHSNRAHVHPATEFACVFYLKTPKDSGNLVLLKNALFRMDNMADLPAKQTNPFNCESFFIEPQKNTLVMFPGHIEHLVEESKTNEDRISLAFNLQVKGNYVKEFDKHD